MGEDIFAATPAPEDIGRGPTDSAYGCPGSTSRGHTSMRKDKLLCQGWHVARELYIRPTLMKRKLNFGVPDPVSASTKTERMHQR